jgi:hypothetical protein
MLPSAPLPTIDYPVFEDLPFWYDDPTLDNPYEEPEPYDDSIYDEYEIEDLEDGETTQ